MRSLIIWVSTALIGLVLAAGLAVVTSRIAGQDIGLSGEPVAAGEQLAPTGAGSGKAGRATERGRRRRSSRPRPSSQGRPQPGVPSGSGKTTQRQGGGERGEEEGKEDGDRGEGGDEDDD